MSENLVLFYSTLFNTVTTLTLLMYPSPEFHVH